MATYFVRGAGRMLLKDANSKLYLPFRYKEMKVNLKQPITLLEDVQPDGPPISYDYYYGVEAVDVEIGALERNAMTIALQLGMPIPALASFAMASGPYTALVPATGPYTVTAPVQFDALSDFLVDVDGNTFTRVTAGSEAAGAYSVAVVSLKSVFTFAAADAGHRIYFGGNVTQTNNYIFGGTASANAAGELGPCIATLGGKRHDGLLFSWYFPALVVDRNVADVYAKDPVLSQIKLKGLVDDSNAYNHTFKYAIGQIQAA